MRTLLFFALIIAIFIGIRFMLKRINQIRVEADRENSDASQDANEIETMVACEVCQVNLPESEALAMTLPENPVQHFACSEAHLETLQTSLNKSQ